MSNTKRPPIISVVIPTFNRATLLRPSLEALANQTLPSDEYEVVVINDGSTDNTPEVCKGFSSRMNLRYFRIENSGISAAKNLGVFTSSGSIVLFCDDDDIADKKLLEEHVKTHERNPEEHFAVLGYTAWSPELEVTPVMEYIMDVGQFLFAYRNLRNGQILDFSYFWGGRTSCKRSLLVKHGVFNQSFRSIIEDIELGYRLSKFGLKVIFNRYAISHMVRPITIDQFCQRSERQGQALVLFSRLYLDPMVQQYCSVPEPINCQISNAIDKWQSIKEPLERTRDRVQEIEYLLASESAAIKRNLLIEELHGLYRWTINGFKLKGIVQALDEGAYMPG